MVAHLPVVVRAVKGRPIRIGPDQAARQQHGPSLRDQKMVGLAAKNAESGDVLMIHQKPTVALQEMIVLKQMAGRPVAGRHVTDAEVQDGPVARLAAVIETGRRCSVGRAIRNWRCFRN